MKTKTSKTKYQTKLINVEPNRETYYIWQTELFPTYPGIYFIYDKKDRLLYVGKGKKVNARIDSHFEGSSHLFANKDLFYRIETHQVSTGDLERLYYEIYYINNYEPLLNKENVLYTNLKTVNDRIEFYFENIDEKMKQRTEVEEVQMGLCFPPEDGHLFTLWEEVQDIKENEHSYHCSSGAVAANKMINQWIENEKEGFLEYIRQFYNLSSIKDVEEQLIDYVRWDKRNIFSLSSSPNPQKGWNPIEIAKQFY